MVGLALCIFPSPFLFHWFSYTISTNFKSKRNGNILGHFFFISFQSIIVCCPTMLFLEIFLSDLNDQQKKKHWPAKNICLHAIFLMLITHTFHQSFHLAIILNVKIFFFFGHFFDLKWEKGHKKTWFKTK